MRRGYRTAADRIAGVLREAKQLYAVATGARCAYHTEWIHVGTTATHTLFTHSHKRGCEGFEIGGVLTDYSWNLINDFLGLPYTIENCDHLRCNAHLLRKLTSCSEEAVDGNRWAAGLIAVLLAMKQAAANTRKRGQNPIKPAIFTPQLSDYNRI